MEGVLSADCIAQKMDSKLMQTIMALQSAIRSVERDLKRSFSTGSPLPWRIHTRYPHVKDLI
jgi:hypothetical protein